MFSGIFFIALGCLLLFFGITQDEWFDIVLGILMMLFACERFYLLATGKTSIFGKKEEEKTD